jgi:putative ABC transport system substrate-binding protein
MKVRGAAMILTLALGLLAAPLSADAQQATKVRRIGVLDSTFSASPFTPLAHMGAFGYDVGRDIIFESRSAAGEDERLPSLAAELVGLGVEVLVVNGRPAVQAARKATGTIPIVMIVEGDPVKAGLVSSLARPGGNITGMTMLTAELNQKRLQLLKEAVPRLTRVAVLWNPGDPDKADEWEDLRAAARLLGVQLHSLEVRRAGDFEPALKAAVRERAGGLLVLADRLTVSHQDVIHDLAAAKRLPAIFPLRTYNDRALLSYAPSRSEMTLRVGTYVDKILKGAKPADLPVEEPREFELVVNLKAARAIGLTLPPSLLLRAYKVVE